MSLATSAGDAPQASTAQSNGTGGFQISRTELVWPGKYNEDGSLKEVHRVSLMAVAGVHEALGTYT